MNLFLIAAAGGAALWLWSQRQKAAAPDDDAAPERTDERLERTRFRTAEELAAILGARAAKDAALPGYKVGAKTLGTGGWYTVLAVGSGQICSRRASFEVVGAYHRVGTQVQSPSGLVGTLDQNCLWQWVS